MSTYGKSAKAEVVTLQLDHLGATMLNLISHNALIEWFQKVNPPRKIVNLMFTITDYNIKLTLWWGG